MTAHSNIGPSSAERWINCPGSVALSAQCPKPSTSFAAAEGSVAHTLAEDLLTGRVDEIGLMTRLGEIVKHDGHEVTVSEEMIEGAILYRDVVHADYEALRREDRPAPPHKKVEERVVVSSVSPDLWGTADCMVFRKGHKLIVYDYKFGKGKVVEVKENPQAALYGLGAMDSATGSAFDEVELVIVQPRAAHVDGRVRRWLAPKEWLESFRETARAAEKLTREPNAPLKAGDWCRWCPAKAGCPTLYQATQTETQADFQQLPATPEVAGAPLPLPALLSEAQLARVLDWRDAIEDWFGAVETRVAELLGQGQAVPGYKLVEGRSIRAWADGSGEQAAAHFRAQYGEKVYAPREILSVAQMEKLVGKKNLPFEYVVRPPGKLKVAHAGDARPEALPPAQQDFKALPAPGAAGRAPCPNCDEILGPCVAHELTTVVAMARGPIWP